MEIDPSKLKLDGYSVIELAHKQVYVVQDFLERGTCTNIVREIHNVMKAMPQRKLHKGGFFSFDVLPVGTESQRIFRSIEYKEGESYQLSESVDLLCNLMKQFQMKWLTGNISCHHSQYARRLQITHYPRGGGFFDWHEHPRFPVNYGMIVNLSQNGENYHHGATEIETDGGKIIRTEEFCNIGDLILFRYDLRHRVGPCDPENDLIFDTNGRWTSIMPIY